jgi:hypothetical protein
LDSIKPPEKNLYYEKKTRKVMKEVLEYIDKVETNKETKAENTKNIKVESTNNKEASNNSIQRTDLITSNKDERQSIKKTIEVTEEYSELMENGKLYKGDLVLRHFDNSNFSNNKYGPTSVDYATITAAINDLNLRGVGGAVTFSLTDGTYPSEPTFPIIINNVQGVSAVNTVTIKPASGVSPVISGASASGPIFKIYRTNYVTIDGSNNGSTSRNMTIQNTSATSPAVVWIGSFSTTPITNVTVKNCTLINGANTNTAVTISDGTTSGNAGYFNNITIQNNSIQLSYIGIYAIGTVVVGNGSGLLISGNDLNTSGSNSIRLIGVYVQGVDGATVSNNNIGNIVNANAESPKGIVFTTGTNSGTISGNTINTITYTGAGAYAPTGISCSPATATSISITNNTVTNITNSVGTSLSFCGISTFSPNTSITNNTVSNLTQSAAYAFWGIVQSGAINSSCSGNTVSGLSTTTTGVTNGINIQGVSTGVMISKNKIYNIKNSNAGGYTAVALALASSSTSSNITATNNIIYDVAGYGYGSQSTDNGYGINIYSGGGYNLYYNSINLATNQTLSTGVPACLIINSAVTTANTLDIRNNIFSIPTTSGTNRYAVLSNAASTVFSYIDYNDYYTSGTNLGYIAGGNVLDLAAWKTATNKDANSISTDPSFTSATDLHIVNNLTEYTAYPAPSCAGTPITGITTDFEGTTRRADYPDIGAYEFVM